MTWGHKQGPPHPLQLSLRPSQSFTVLFASPFLGPRGPLVLPSVGSFVPSRPQEKSGSLIYRHICLMNHEKTHQTNPMGPGGLLDALLTPWDPLATPQTTPSDPYTGLLASLHSQDHLNCLTNHIHLQPRHRCRPVTPVTAVTAFT